MGMISFISPVIAKDKEEKEIKGKQKEVKDETLDTKQSDKKK